MTPRPLQLLTVRPRATIVTVVFLVVWGLITHGTFAGSGDEPHYMMIAHSLAFDRDLDLTNDYASHPALIAGGTLMPENHAVPGKDGRLRPAHDIGLPLLAAPLVFVAYPLAEWIAHVTPPRLMERARLNAELVYRHMFSLVMALVTGLLALQLFAILQRFGMPVEASIAWSLLITLSPPVLSHSFLFFTEIPSALLAIWLYRTLTDGRPLLPRGPLVGFAIGLLLLIHVRNIGLVAVFVVYVVSSFSWTGRVVSGFSHTDAVVSGFSRTFIARDFRLFALCLAVPIAIRCAAMYVFWGTFLTSPLARRAPDISTSELVMATGRNLWGMLTDFNVGLLSVGPIYLLAIPGMLVVWKRSRSASLLLVAAIGVYLLTIAIPAINVHGYGGGFAPAARMILPVVPLMGIAVCLAAHSARGLARAGVIMLVLTQVGIDIVMWNKPKRLWSGAQARIEDVTRRDLPLRG